MLQGKSLSELAQEIMRQNEVKRDFIVDSGELIMKVHEDGIARLEFADQDLGINEIFHDQLGDKLGIPSKYYDRMRREQPELLAANVNTWFHAQPERQMVRTLDNTARAFLSDRYRRIDNYEIAQHVLPLIADMPGAQVLSCEITERKMYLKVVNPRIETEIVQGDVVQAGIVISNSETGYGAVSVMPLVYRLVCSNGMIAADSGTRRYHIGRQNDADDNYMIYRDETVLADDRAFMYKLQDTVRAAVDEVRFKQIAGRMIDAKQLAITSPSIPAVVELTGKQFGLSEGENTNVLDHLIRGGDLSLFGLSNAITRAAQDIQSYDRSTELEALGYKVLTMPQKTWHQLNVA